MIKKIIMLILIVILPIINIHAFALVTNDIDVELDYDNMTFKINALVEENRAHKVMLVVTQPSESQGLTIISDSDDIDSIREKLYAVQNTKIDAAGEFSFEIPVIEGARVGFYGFRIGVTGVRADGEETDELYVFQGKKFYADEIERQNIFGAFSQENADVDNLLNTYGKGTEREVLDADTSNSVYVSNKNEVIEIFKTLRQEIEFESFEDVDTAFSIAVAVTDLNNGTIEQEKIDLYTDVLGLNVNEFFTSEVKEDVAESLNDYKEEKGSGFAGIIELRNEFDKAFFLAAVNRATREDITVLVNGYKALNLSYDSLNPNEVNKALTDSDFGSVEEFVEAFNKSVAAVKESINKEAEKESAHTKPSGGGGSGVKMNVENSKETENFEEPAITERPVFNDLDNVLWAHEAINYLHALGIDGVGDGAFAPNRLLKREEGAKMLVLSLNLETDGKIAKFSDVSIGQWYYPYVAAAYEEAILCGTGDGHFGIGQSFTREDFALMLYRVVEDYLVSDEYICDFTDTYSISSYALQAVGALSNNGIINGMEDGSFAPKACVTRAQAAKMIYGAICLMNGGSVR